MLFYCKQQIIQLYFEWNISYRRIAKVLIEERLKVSKKTVWTTVSNYKVRGALSRLPGSGGYIKLTPKV